MAQELTGQRFGSLTVTERAPEKRDKYALWKCRCDCGGEVLATSRQLTRGTVKDCGCAKREDDLTGRAFGSLTVIGRGERGWQCRCECGNEIEASAADLLRGHKKSCGCLKNRMRGEDIAGRRSGRLVAVEPTEEMRRGVTLWRCKCDCGQEILVEGYRIASGRVTSCGCSRVGQGVKDLAGRRFGHLTAIERLEEKSGSNYLWRCRCDCGKETKASTHKLIAGEVVSCGCMQDPRKHLHFIDGTCVEMIGQTKVRSDNRSGVTGVHEVRGQWRAMITFKKKTYYLGTYRTKEEAAEVRRRAEERIFGEFLEWYYGEFLKKEMPEEEKPEAGS